MRRDEEERAKMPHPPVPSPQSGEGGNVNGGRLWVRVLIWFLVLGGGLVVLRGRYDWSVGVQRYSLRGYLSSAYMFLFVVPTVYFLLTHFVKQRWFVLGSSAGLWVVLVLPYRWLGLALPI